MRMRGLEIERGSRYHNLPLQSSTAEDWPTQLQQTPSIQTAIHLGQQQMAYESVPGQGHQARHSRPSSQVERRSLLEPDHNEKYSGANHSLFGSIQQSPTNLSQKIGDQGQLHQYDEPMLLM